MLIACPDCNAGYDVPDALLSSARMMRCAACGHDWMTDAVAPEPAAARGGEMPGTDIAGPEMAQIDCPACGAAYELPAVMLAQPRMMRCATCGHDWETAPRRAAAPAARSAMPAMPPAPMPAPEPPPAGAQASGTQASILDRVETDTSPPTVAPPQPLESLEDARAGETVRATTAENHSGLESGVAAHGESDAIAALRVAVEATASSPSELNLAELSLAERVRMTLQTSRISLAGWAISLVVWLVMAQTLVGKRAAIAESWPPSQRLFLWLGLG